jgi:hypothetical protein
LCELAEGDSSLNESRKYSTHRRRHCWPGTGCKTNKRKGEVHSPETPYPEMKDVCHMKQSYMKQLGLERLGSVKTGRRHKSLQYQYGYERKDSLGGKSCLSKKLVWSNEVK